MDAPDQASPDPKATRAGQTDVGVMTTASGLIGLVVAALTLGLYLKRALPARMGRNAAFDPIGKVALALSAGAVACAVALVVLWTKIPECRAADS